ncbi:MAG: XrtA-associated tyrosine autokinase [Candidatus Scalindua sp.]
MSIIEKFLDKLDKHNKDFSEAPGQTAGHGEEYNSDYYPAKQGITSKCTEVFEPQGIDKSLLNDSGPGDELSGLINIDLDELNMMGFITPETRNIKLFEQFRYIKMQLLSNTLKKGASDSRKSNIIVITSAIAGEGKTYSSMNLALSIAYEYNNTVLYIDADVSKQTATKLLKLDARRGLTDYLLEIQPDISRLLLKTNLPKFRIMPAGKFHERTTELFASKRMQSLMNELSERYNDRLIIIDSPPLLQDTSATALAQLADQTVIVIEAEKTPKHIVEEAIRSVKTDKYIGLLFNKSNQRYGSGYSYYSY